MKIAFLSFYSGKIDRGVEVASLALCQHLSKNHQVTLYQVGERTVADVVTTKIPVWTNWEKSDSSNSFFRLFYLDYWSRKITLFTLKVLPFLYRGDYDVIIPTNGGWQVVFCRLITWLLGSKMIIQGNAGIGRDDLFGLHCFPDHYIAISPNGYSWSTRFAPWVKKTYIPYGIDISLFNQAKPVSVSLKKPIVLCVGAFSRYKRIELLIRAMTLVNNASLLVIGMGQLESELREMGNNLLGKRFLLITDVTHDMLIGYYKTADLFSLPSKSSEAFGIVYIEAMAAGLSIVSPDDWRRDIIGDAGIYVDVEDSNAYARSIDLALKNHVTRRKALAQAKKYSWDSIVLKYEKLIMDL